MPTNSTYPRCVIGQVKETSLNLILKVYLRYYLSVEEINNTVGKAGIMLRVGHHHNGGAFLMQLGK